MNTQEIKHITYEPSLREFDEFCHEEKIWKTIHYMTDIMKRTYDKIKDTSRFRHLDALFSEAVKNIPNTSVVVAKSRSKVLVASETYPYPMISSAYPTEDETTKMPQCLVPYGNKPTGASIDMFLQLICRDDGEGIAQYEASMGEQTSDKVDPEENDK